MHRTLVIFSACSALLLGSPAPAQNPTAATAIHAHGVCFSDGALTAFGPDYSARFERGSIVFTPALGAAAPRTGTLRYALASVGRGAGEVFAAGDGVEPSLRGERICYQHNAELTEVYEARDDGVEQSFVFATRPAGSGDLVVRGTIATDLVLTAASDAGVRYQQPGNGSGGGVSFGAVTGVDANGATTSGSIRVASDGRHVEWVLPAAFVDAAEYPLVLDPLLGTSFTVGNGAGGADQLPSVTYDLATNRYLVVWNVVMSATSAELRGQIVSASGGLLLSAFVIDGFGDSAVRPGVASVRDTGRCLVAWKRNRPAAGVIPADVSVYTRAVALGNGTMSQTVLVEAPGLTTPIAAEVAVGGDQRTGLFGFNENALVVLGKRGGGIFTPDNVVSAFLVHVPTAGDPTVGAPQAIRSSVNALGNIAVTSNAGSQGRWLVAFCQGPVANAPYTSVLAQLIDDGGFLCGTALPIATGTTGVSRPTTATRDGAHFAVAWQDDATLGILARTLVWNGNCGGGSATLGAIVDPNSAGLDSRPQLEFAQHKYLLAWRRSFLVGGSPQIYVKGLDADDCAACGVEWSVDGAASANDMPALASHWSGGDTASDEALVVWSNGTIRARRCEARGNDVVTSMGGGCSLAGFNDFATYNGDAVLGATDFELVLANPVSLPVLMIVGFSNLSSPCGSCTIVPNPDVLLPAINPMPVSIPCNALLVGVDLYTQWLLLKPSDCPILPDFAFSTALRFTIGE